MPLRNEIKIILYSVILNETLIAQALALGAAACLPKPFDLMEMKRLIREVLEKESYETQK